MYKFNKSDIFWNLNRAQRESCFTLAFLTTVCLSTPERLSRTDSQRCLRVRLVWNRKVYFYTFSNVCSALIVETPKCSFQPLKNSSVIFFDVGTAVIKATQYYEQYERWKCRIMCRWLMVEIPSRPTAIPGESLLSLHCWCIVHCLPPSSVTIFVVNQRFTSLPLCFPYSHGDAGQRAEHLLRRRADVRRGRHVWGWEDVAPCF